MKQTVLSWMLAGVLVVALAPATCPGSQKQKPAEAAEGETYTYIVTKGDTLWDICDELYDDSWVWPKLWQLNPHITNPHWIYPGTRLQVYYEIPKSVAAVEQAAPPAPPPTRPATFTCEEIDQVGFITPTRPPGSGEVIGEKNQKYLLSMTDEIYVKLRHSDQALAGDRYFVFKTSDLIRHPITDQKVGYLNSILGIVEIVEVAPDHARAMVCRSYHAITAGDKLMPYRKRSEEIILRDGTAPKEGYIVLADDQRRLIGGRQIVFIDLGENEEVRPGHRFSVFREPMATDLLRRESELALTAQPIGRLLVLSVEEETAAALVTNATGEFIPGERVRLKVRN
ncbi:MAG: LysM peptidoglycan-binding domain-containing protein [Syntrophobacteria bacterium]